MTEPRIAMLPETHLVGRRLTMSVSNNKTAELWQGFMPLRNQIPNRSDNDYYLVEIYPGVNFFKQFNQQAEFEKWAAVKVNDTAVVPDSMETLVIPSGLYAVFPFKGVPADVPQFLQYVFSTWMPQSGYLLDDRPHFALMGEKYKNNDPDSEEDFWIPIQPK